jgi:UDP-N-acetylglucosamine:LPS N-acetylglucosamine transferase
VVIEERDLNPALADTVTTLISDRDRRGQMARAARALARPDAAARIADRVEELAHAR